MDEYKNCLRCVRIVGGTSAKSSSTLKPLRLFQSSWQYSVIWICSDFGRLFFCIQPLSDRSFHCDSCSPPFIAIEIVVILLWACVQKLKPKSMESENNMSNLTGTGAAVLRKISTEWFAKPRTAAAAGQGGDVTKRKHANVAVLDKTWLK